MMAGILLIPVLVVYVLSTLAGGCGRIPDTTCGQAPASSLEKLNAGHEFPCAGDATPMTTSTGHP